MTNHDDIHDVLITPAAGQVTRNAVQRYRARCTSDARFRPDRATPMSRVAG